MRNPYYYINKLAQLVCTALILFLSLNPFASAQISPPVTSTPPQCPKLNMLCGPNLVSNGDFEQGNTGFSSDYTYVTSPGTAKTYAIHYNANVYYPNHWWTRDDVTYGTEIPYVDDTDGLFFLGDAQESFNGFNDLINTRAWYQTISVQTGVLYNFEFYACNLDDETYANRAIFNIRANGQLLFEASYIIEKGSKSPYGRWKQLCGQYLSTVTGSVEISINVIPGVKPGESTILGADFGLDEISFKAVSAPDADFSWSPASPCRNTHLQMIPNSMAGIHSWNFGSSDAFPSNTSNLPAPTVSYPSGGYKTIVHSVTLPGSTCTNSVSKPIVVREDCNAVHACQEGLTCTNNLALNGDFESGNNNVGSDLSYHDGSNHGSCNGRYLIVSDATAYEDDASGNYPWQTSADHTEDPGNLFMVADPPCNNTSGQIVWSQFHNIELGKSYNFSAWVSNLRKQLPGSPSSVDPINEPRVALAVQFLTHEIQVSAPSTIPYSADINREWTELCGSFVSPATGAARFIIRVGASNEVEYTQADIGLDDIKIMEVSPGNPTFTYAAPNFCTLTDISFVATEGGTSWTHSWDFGDGTPPGSGATTSHAYLTPSDYKVTHRITHNTTGCWAETSLIIKIVNCGCSIDPGSINVIQCSVSTFAGVSQNNMRFQSTASAGNSQTQITSYDWNFEVGNPPAVKGGTFTSPLVSFLLKPDVEDRAVVRLKVWGSATTGIVDECYTEICREYIIDNCPEVLVSPSLACGEVMMAPKDNKDASMQNYPPVQAQDKQIKLYETREPSGINYKVEIREDGDLYIIVYDIYGSKAWEQKKLNLTPGLHALDGMPPLKHGGVYLMRLETNHTVQFNRIWVE